MFVYQNYIARTFLYLFIYLYILDTIEMQQNILHQLNTLD